MKEKMGIELGRGWSTPGFQQALTVIKTCNLQLGPTKARILCLDSL
jgi:hypothetical protein